MNSTAYDENKPYAFISYSHTDKEKVESILRKLEKKGKRFWYDVRIDYGDEWERVIDEHIEKSSVFILFAAQGVEQRSEIIRELRKAIFKKKAAEKAGDKEYKIFIVLLERVNIPYMFREYEDILKLCTQVQYISAPDYKGITISFMERISSDAIWRYCATEEENEQTDSFEQNNELAVWDDVLPNTDYIYPYAYPQERTKDGVEFFSINIGETDPNAVYPMCMDNQWYPYEFYEDEGFIKDGLKDENSAAKRTAMQQHEIISALLHNRQILINRASIFNTNAIAKWFYNASDHKAFCTLLQNGSIVVYLMDETSPINIPKLFSVEKKQFEAWENICKEVKVYCIRMSWDDFDGKDEANKFEVSRKLTRQLMDLLLTTANDPYRIELFRNAMGIPEDKKVDFTNLWKNIRNTAIKGDDEKSGAYSRKSVYEDFLVKEGTEVTECIIDYNKPFVRELKQIVDFRYTINLPMALHITPRSSYETQLWDYEISERRGFKQLRIISVDELCCAVVSFAPDFLQDVPLLASDDISLADVVKIRQTDEWMAYIETLDASRRRSSINVVDFYDIEMIWKRYKTLLIACNKNIDKLKTDKVHSTISIIYHFGNASIVTAYDKKSDVIRIMTKNEKSLSDTSRGNVKIDFVFGDVLSCSTASNCFLEELCLFEGILLESGREGFNQVLKTLTEHKHTIERR